MKTINVGFIGTGGKANGHMNGLLKLEGVNIVSICDIVEEKTQQALDRQNIVCDTYTNHKDMLEREDLDIIYICLPVFCHGQPELDVIERGLPFLVEKPVAINMDIARQIEEEVLKNSIPTCVGYQLRYMGSVQITEDLLKDKTINMVTGRYWCGSGRSRSGHWLQQMDKSGGQLVEQATHTFDMMRYLFGEVESVYVKQSNRYLKHLDGPDSNCVILEFSNGVIGTLTAGWAYSGGWAETNVIDVLYEDQLLTWKPKHVTLKKDDNWIDKTQSAPSINEVFIEAVRNNDTSQILSPFSDAVKTLQVTLACNLSGKENRLVKVSEL